MFNSQAVIDQGAQIGQLRGIKLRAERVVCGLIRIQLDRVGEIGNRPVRIPFIDR